MRAARLASTGSMPGPMARMACSRRALSCGVPGGGPLGCAAQAASNGRASSATRRIRRVIGTQSPEWVRWVKVLAREALLVEIVRMEDRADVARERQPVGPQKAVNQGRGDGFTFWQGLCRILPMRKVFRIITENVALRSCSSAGPFLFQGWITLSKDG